MYFKLICYLSLVVADIFLTKWIPLKETLHYYFLNHKLQLCILSKDNKSFENNESDKKDEDFTQKELVMQQLAKKTEERLDLLRMYWVLQGIVCYVSYLFDVFPFVYEGRVMMLIMVSNTKMQKVFFKSFIQKQVSDNPRIKVRIKRDVASFNAKF